MKTKHKCAHYIEDYDDKLVVCWKACQSMPDNHKAYVECADDYSCSIGYSVKHWVQPSDCSSVPKDGRTVSLCHNYSLYYFVHYDSIACSFVHEYTLRKVFLPDHYYQWEKEYFFDKIINIENLGIIYWIDAELENKQK